MHIFRIEIYARFLKYDGNLDVVKDMLCFAKFITIQIANDLFEYFFEPKKYLIHIKLYQIHGSIPIRHNEYCRIFNSNSHIP